MKESVAMQQIKDVVFTTNGRNGPSVANHAARASTRELARSNQVNQRHLPYSVASVPWSQWMMGLCFFLFYFTALTGGLFTSDVGNCASVATLQRICCHWWLAALNTLIGEILDSRSQSANNTFYYWQWARWYTLISMSAELPSCLFRFHHQATRRSVKNWKTHVRAMTKTAAMTYPKAVVFTVCNCTRAIAVQVWETSHFKPSFDRIWPYFPCNNVHNEYIYRPQGGVNKYLWLPVSSTIFSLFWPMICLWHLGTQAYLYTASSVFRPFLWAVSVMFMIHTLVPNKQLFQTPMNRWLGRMGTLQQIMWVW